MRKLWLGALTIPSLAIVMSACSANNGASPATTAAPTTSAAAKSTATTSAPPTTAPAAPAAPASTPAPAPSSATNSGTVPNYQPSSVVGEATGHTQLSSPDGVAKVTAFYEGVLRQNGWSLSSSNKTATSANLIAHRSGQGATVAISTAGPSGTSISISTYAQ
jgi:hypothetical protein